VRARRIGIVAAAAAALALPAAVVALPDGSATVRFGNDVGSPYPPPEHDASGNAKDNLVPRTVTIAAGGAVTYEIAGAQVSGPHQPAVYAAGTEPEDIALLGPGPWVNDPDGRVALGPPNFAPATLTWTTPAGTFATPGKYLVLCNFLPHFAFANMYGWVIVK
jgi:plastocyanin